MRDQLYKLHLLSMFTEEDDCTINNEHGKEF